MKTDPLELLLISQAQAQRLPNMTARRHTHRPRPRFGWLHEREHKALIALCCEDLDPLQVQQHAETLGNALDKALAVEAQLTEEFAAIEEMTRHDSLGE